jgi:fatty-acyl-CoA synthase
MTRAPFSRTIDALLCEQAARYPDALAVICGSDRLSYAELYQRALRIAARLRSVGVAHGHRVGVLVSNRIEWLESFIAATMTGATVVPISTWSKAAEIEFILRDSEIHTLIAMRRCGGENFLESLLSIVPTAQCSFPGTWTSTIAPRLREVFLLDDASLSDREDSPPTGFRCYSEEAASTLVSTPPPGPPGIGASAGDIGIILYTSGSTSRPKAVPLRHYALIENGFNIGERQGLDHTDRVFVSVPLFWAYGSANALMATFSHGATLVLQERFEAAAALELIETERCTSIYTLPAMTAALVGHPSFAITRTRSLRTGLTIGSPQDVIRAAEVLGAKGICNIYGSSETYGNCCVTPTEWPLTRRSQCQGPPLPGMRLRLVNPETGVAAAPGEPGLIEVCGYIIDEYLGHSAASNSSTFTADGWYRTYDVGEWTSEGDINFLGRRSEMIKRAGINVSPAEVEDVLLQHPAVAATAVVGAPDADRGECIVAFVVLHDEASVSDTDLVVHCRSMASSYKSPDRIVFRDSLPATVTGKLLRQSLKDEAIHLSRRHQPGDAHGA